MDFKKIYEFHHQLDAPLQPIEDDSPFRESNTKSSRFIEMSSPTSESLANTFLGVLRSLGISEKEGITDEKLKEASKVTINKFGAGKKEGLNFNLSEEEKKSENPKMLIF
jgi:hypothetical protein